MSFENLGIRAYVSRRVQLLLPPQKFNARTVTDFSEVHF